MFDFIFRRRKKTPLEIFQSRLLALLYAGLPPETVRDILLSDKKIARYHDYIAAMDMDMLATGSVLVRKWGNRANVQDSTPEA